MLKFTRKVSLKQTDGIYHVTAPAADDSENEMFSYVLAVPLHKQQSFEAAMKQDEVNLEAYGRILYYGAGSLTEAHIESIVAEAMAA